MRKALPSMATSRLRPVGLEEPWEKSMPRLAMTVPSFTKGDRGRPRPESLALLNTEKKLRSAL